MSLSGAGLYLATLAPGLGGTVDSAEFQHAAYNLSIVHPTGYPFYLLVARLWITLLPLGNIAWRVNLLSAVFAVAALLVVYATVVYLCRSPFGGVLAAALVGTHALVWETAVVAEVNSLNLLLLVATFYALLRWGVEPAAPGAGRAVRRWPLEWAALLYGLALSHHRTSALTIPAVLVFVVWMIRRGAPFSRAIAARSLGLLLLPALFYLYLPLRAGTTPWYSNTWANFSAEVGGASAWPVILDTLKRPLLPRIRIVWESVFPGLHGLASALLGGAGLLLWTRFPQPGWRSARPGLPMFALYLLSFVAICGMMVIYDVDVIGDYLALTVPLVATWAGVAAGWGLASLRGRRLPALGTLPLGVALLGAALLLVPSEQVHANYTTDDFSHFDEPHQFWQGIAAWDSTAQALPQGAFVIGGWTRYNELRYLQTVEGWRPDLYPVVEDDLIAGDRLNLIDDWLKQTGGQGVFLLDATPEILDHFAATDRGTLWQITRRQEAPAVTMQHPLNITFGSDIHLLGYTLQPEQPHTGGTLRITLFWQTDARLQERYVEFTHLIDNNLNKIGQKDDEPGHGYRPTVNWTPGQTIADTLDMPILPGTTPGKYRLIVGLYTRIGEKRLPATDASGRALGDYWEMTIVQVTH